MSAPEPRLPGAEPRAAADPSTAAVDQPPRVAVVPTTAPGDDDLFGEMSEPAPAPRRAVAPVVTTPPVVAAAPVAPVTAAPAAVAVAEVDHDDELDELDEIEVPTGWRGRPKGKLKARRVRRVVRYVSPWSVFKVSLLFSVCLWLILMVAGVILWQGAEGSGMVANIEKFLAKLLAEQSFTIDGRELFRATAIAGVMLVFAGSAFSVLLALLFNVISDITGGIRFTVLELEDAVREVKVPAAEPVRASSPTMPAAAPPVARGPVLAPPSAGG
ncbi:MAG: DUF3566 domain-containing protein [Acidimicrobiales bacterium]